MDNVRVEITHDKPNKGQWHCGPNPCWVTVTHIPSMTQVRLYSGNKSQHQVRGIAIELLDLALLETSAENCSFPEVLNG